MEDIPSVTLGGSVSGEAVSSQPTRMFADAYIELMRSVQGLFEMRYQRSEELSLELARGFRKGWFERDADAGRKVYENFVESSKDLVGEDRKHELVAAFDNYVSAVREAFSDPEQLDPLSLAAIAQSMWFAAYNVQVAAAYLSPSDE